MQRLSTFATLVLLATASSAHADAPITITINSNNAVPAPPPPPPIEAPPTPPIEAPPAPPSTVEPTTAPSPTCAAVAVAPTYAPHRTLMIGIFGGRGGAANTTTDDAKTGGIRASLDLFAHRHWAFGVAGTIVGRDDNDKADAAATPPAPIGSSLVAYVAYTHPINAKLDIRFELGGGVGQLPDTATTMTTAKATTPADDPQQAKRFLRVGEASITLTHMWNDRWGISGGPVVTVAHPSDIEDDRDDPHPAHTVAFFAALTRRL